MNTVLNLSAAPHARDKWTTPFIMRMVTLSLLPATIVGILVYGWNAFGIVALAVVSAVAAEWLFCKACKKPSTIWDGSAVVTGLLLALSLGPQTPLYIPVIGSVFAVVVCKGCFGGLGKNFINPALAARCFLLISFANAMAIKPVVDAVATATPVGAMKAGEAVDITKMFLGTADGVIGSSILALLAGGLLLWSMDIIHGQICFSVLIGFTLFLGLFGGKGFDPAYLLAHLCGGGVVMGAFFMATDYVTSPVSRLGQFIYGCLIGVLGGLFRLKGNTADSFSYAIIIGNVCTPLIDTYIVQKPFAYRKLGKTRKTSKEPFRIPKPVIEEQWPGDRYVPVGWKTELELYAEGRELQYQWQYFNGSQWVDAVSEDAKDNWWEFTVKQSMDGRQYRCAVTDAAGNRVFSDVVTLRVIATVETELSGWLGKSPEAFLKAHPELVAEYYDEEGGCFEGNYVNFLAENGKISSIDAHASYYSIDGISAKLTASQINAQLKKNGWILARGGSGYYW